MQLSQPIYRLKRRARILSRTECIPLHRALDRVASEQGFRNWSLLARHESAVAARKAILGRLVPGDLVLLAGRPGQGKTMLSFELAAEAMKRGRTAAVFTLDYTTADVRRSFRELGMDPDECAKNLRLDTSDSITATYMVDQLESTPAGTLFVVDYLQVLDQRRENPELSEQVAQLRSFGQARGLITIVLAQIDRRFDGRARKLPRLDDVRLPNPVDLELFTATCFVHEGRVEFERTA